MVKPAWVRRWQRRVAWTAVMTLVAAVPLVLPTASAPASAQAPAGLADQPVIDGLNQPMDVEFSPDGRVYVAEKRGVIVEFDSLADPTPTTVVDLRTVVNSNHDRGLMSFALSPDFPSDPSAWVLYAYDAAIGGTAPRWGTPGGDEDDCPNPPGGTDDGCVISGRLARIDLSQPNGGPEHVLINDWCQQFDSHSLGHLQFGPDGYLYASAGDGASYNWADYGQKGAPLNPCGDPPAGVGGVQTPPQAEGGALRAQDYQTPGDPQGLDGTIIRIDPQTGAGAPSNPLAARQDPNARRIIAAGLRNPFRFTFRPGTNELWIGDVGYNDWEEVNRLSNPVDGTVHNFGWPCQEGNGATGGYATVGLTLCDRIYSGSVPTVAPFFVYQHGQPVVAGDGCADANGSSISAAAFYEGNSYPTAYHPGAGRDAFFFGDYSRGCLWVMLPDDNGVPDPSSRRLFESGVYPVDLQRGPGDDLFYVDIAKGQVRRIVATGGNAIPTAAVATTPDHGPLPLHVNLSAAGSSDVEPGALSYAWDLDGDGQYDDATGVTTSTTYTVAGEYHPAVRVTDAGGASSVAQARVLAGTSPPVPVIDTPSASFTFRAGQQIAFSGHATDPDDGAVPASRLKWTVVLDHCPSEGHCHQHPLTARNGVASGTFDAIDHEYPMYLELQLTATDSTGVSTTVTRPLYPKVHNLTVATSPAGLEVTVGSHTGVAPFTLPVVEGSDQGVAVPATVTLPGSTMSFHGWSDGGARVHNLTVGTADTTLTASFTRTVGRDPALVADYDFDEGGGTILHDRSGHGNDGTLAGPTWVTGGRTGGALSFAGEDTVTVADAPGLDLTTGMTLEAWLRPSTSSGWRAALAKESPSGLSYALYGSVLASETDASLPGPPGGFADVGGETSARGARALPVDTWSHVAVTYDGQQLRFYVDGQEVGSAPKPGAITTSTGALRLGANLAFGGEYYQGLLDDVRVYDRALSGVEIQLDQDRTAPTVAVSGPAPGARLAGNVVVTAQASDAGGVAGVQLQVDGKPLGPEDTEAPYAVAWDTAAVPEGQHTLTAVARDRFGNIATSPPVPVAVAGTPAAPAYAAPGAVRALRVSGRVSSARRMVSWRPPAVTGGTPVTAYIVTVRKGSRILLTRQLTGRRLTLSRRALRSGRLVVIVRARNRVGSGASAAVSFRVRRHG